MLCWSWMSNNLKGRVCEANFRVPYLRGRPRVWMCGFCNLPLSCYNEQAKINDYAKVHPSFKDEISASSSVRCNYYPTTNKRKRVIYWSTTQANIIIIIIMMPLAKTCAFYGRITQNKALHFKKMSVGRYENENMLSYDK